MELNTIDDLEVVVNKAIESELSLGIFVEMPGFPMPELITNPVVNLEKKLGYWKKTYDENLEHKYAKGIKIVGTTLGLYTGSFVREGDK